MIMLTVDEKDIDKLRLNFTRYKLQEQLIEKLNEVIKELRKVWDYGTERNNQEN